MRLNSSSSPLGLKGANFRGRALFDGVRNEGWADVGHFEISEGRTRGDGG
jgi:hypothetical protein